MDLSHQDLWAVKLSMLFHHSYKVTWFEWAVIETSWLAIIGFLFQMVLCILLSGQVNDKLLSVTGGTAVKGPLGLLPGKSESGGQSLWNWKLILEMAINTVTTKAGLPNATCQILVGGKYV